MRKKSPPHQLLIPPRPALPAAVLAAAREAATRYARSARAGSTWRAYESDWRLFNAWCQSVKRSALPAEPSTVALFLAAEAELGRAPSTLGRRLAAIRLMHVGARVAPPHDALEVAEVMRGIRRAWQRPAVQKAPALDADIQRMIDTLDLHTLRGQRDRALLLVGFAGALRRSELVALDVEHLTVRPEGLELRIPRSKTDQEGAGDTVALMRVHDSPYCPVGALQAWLRKAAIPTGAVFRRLHRGDTLGASRLTAQSVALIIKDLAHHIGLDARRYAGHSLRSGFLTSAARNRASIFKMADQSRHKSLDVLRDYVRNEARFEDHAAEGMLQTPRA